MAKIVWQAPSTEKTQGQRTTQASPRRFRLAALIPFLLLLAACGSVVLPDNAILPSDNGNVVLQFKPADAEVVLVEEGFETSGSGARASTVDESGHGVLTFSLKPGSYRFRITKAGYRPYEGTVVVDEESAASGSTTVIDPIELEADSGTAPDGGETDSGTAPDGDEGNGSGDAGSDSDGGSAARAAYSIVGDPTFSVSSLSDEERKWYERFWTAIRNPDSDHDPDRMAASDDVYVYGRDLHNHLQTLLLVFRATGDLRVLDEVDRLAEIMRSELRDEWTGTLDGSDGKRDGYLGWAHRYGSYPEFEGKDTHETNEVKTHAVVAAFAYALDANRDLESPAGRKYGEHADFWREYLTDHFEAKWRERKGKSSGYPVLMRPHTHTYMSGLKYHYYMYKLTGNEAYLAEAERNSRVLWENEFEETSVGSGRGLVWPRSVMSEGGDEYYLHPTVYARYVYADAIEMFFAGFDRWANEDNMALFANPVAEWVIDVEGARSGNDWFARDIGGGDTRAGIPSDGDWKRLNTLGFSWSPYTLLAPWDASGRITDISVETLEDLGELTAPTSVHIPAGLFLKELITSN